MLAAARAIWREEALFVAAALLVLYGAVACTIAPYQSLLAIETFGLSHLAYAVVLVAGALVFVTTSITGGRVFSGTGTVWMKFSACALPLSSNRKKWYAPT